MVVSRSNGSSEPPRRTASADVQGNDGGVGAGNEEDAHVAHAPVPHDGEDQVSGHDEGAAGEDVQRPFLGPVRVPRVEDDDEEGKDVREDSQELTHRAFKAERCDDGRREICERISGSAGKGVETQARARRTSEGVEGVGQAEVASGKGPELPALQAVERFLLVKVLVGSLGGASLVSLRSTERSRCSKLTLGANGPMR